MFKYYCKECIAGFNAEFQYTEKVQYCPICGSNDIFLQNPTEEGYYAT